MSIASKFVLITVVGFIGLLLLGYFKTRPVGSDSDQVLAALNASIAASKNGDAGSVQDRLSQAFEVNGDKPGATNVAKAIRKFRPDLTVIDPKPVVVDDQATIVAPVRARVTALGMSLDQTVPGVSLFFKRERATAWLIYPTWKWRLTSIQLSPEAFVAFQNFGSGSLGF